MVQTRNKELTNNYNSKIRLQNIFFYLKLLCSFLGGSFGVSDFLSSSTVRCDVMLLFMLLYLGVEVTGGGFSGVLGVPGVEGDLGIPMGLFRILPFTLILLQN